MTPPSSSDNAELVAAVQAIAAGIAESNAQVSSVIAEREEGNRVRVESE